MCDKFNGFTSLFLYYVSTDAANTPLHPAGNTDPAETDASSVTWSHLWTEKGNKVSGVTAMFLSETPDDSATDGTPEIGTDSGNIFKMYQN